MRIDFGSIIVIGLSVLLWAAAEWFFPIDSTNPNAVKQKHFWSIILSIFSLVIGFDMKNSFDMQGRVDNVGAVFHRLDSSDIEEKFQSIFTLYQQHFDHAKPILRGWAVDALNQLNQDMKEGYISLPPQVAPREIGLVYQYAHQHIVASNVGNTNVYFSSRDYIAANTAARNRGIPVIRFYLWSKDHAVQLTGSTQPKLYSKDEFFQEVKALNAALGTVYSVMIDVDQVSPPLAAFRDMLLLDDSFVAESRLSTNWSLLRAQATEDKGNIDDAANYLHTLMSAIQPDYVAPMSDEDVRTYFHHYEKAKAEPGRLAEQIFNDVMKDVTGR